MLMAYLVMACIGMACMGMACIVMAPSCGTSWMVGSGPIAGILLRSVAYYLHAYMPTCVHAYTPTRLHVYMPTCLHAYTPQAAVVRPINGVESWNVLDGWIGTHHGPSALVSCLPSRQKKTALGSQADWLSSPVFLYGSMGSSWICCCTYRAAATDMFGSRTKLRALLAIHGAYFRPWATIQAMSHAAGYGPCCRP